MKVTIEIDKNSGFCFGVIKAVDRAEKILQQENKLFCLGEIVHNQSEVKRLEKMGLSTINNQQYKDTEITLKIKTKKKLKVSFGKNGEKKCILLKKIDDGYLFNLRSNINEIKLEYE